MGSMQFLDATSGKPKATIRLLSLAGFLLMWKLASLWMDSTILLPSPEETFIEIWVLLRSEGFYLSLSATLVRGIAGFIISVGSGIIVGIMAGRSAVFREFIRPYLTVIQSTPVLAIILLALIWFPTETVPIFVSFLMGFPIVTGNLIEGIQGVDPRLMEMSRVYRLGKWKRSIYIIFPSILPYIVAGASAALGLSWRVVVAAEVLSQPLWGIGTGLQESKMRLETPRVFAWTLAALGLSYLTEAGFRKFVERLKKRV
ncbi:MAG TPA: ABC transporter permease subunit [Spirochaetales bacterium]|nr:ABC transporter permease subunit [Spirochaetales bacterium]